MPQCDRACPLNENNAGILHPNAVEEQAEAFALADPDDLVEGLQYQYVPLEARIMMFDSPELLTDAQRTAIWLFKYGEYGAG